MDCPKCYGKTTVVETKVNEDYVRRRRECLECGHRYTTVEMVIDDIKLYIRQKAFYEKCKKMFIEEKLGIKGLKIKDVNEVDNEQRETD